MGGWVGAIKKERRKAVARVVFKISRECDFIFGASSQRFLGLILCGCSSGLVSKVGAATAVGSSFSKPEEKQ